MVEGFRLLQSIVCVIPSVILTKHNSEKGKLNGCSLLLLVYTYSMLTNYPLFTEDYLLNR